jgi:hypothetical protein
MLPRSLLLGTVALGALLVAPLASAQTSPPSADKGFVPETGQINRGAAHLPPAPTPPTPTANHEDVRAALLMPNPGTISLGEQPDASGKAQPETTGKGITSDEQAGPIGSQLQTKPAKFSHRNDAIDHTPTMGMPYRLDAQQQQTIVHAVMSTDAPVADAEKFKPADALPYSAATKVRPLPPSLRDLQSVAKLDFRKGKDKVYLVSNATAVPIVVDILESK